MFLLCGGLCFSISPSTSWAAPIPGTSSAGFLNHHPGLYISPKGFLIHLGGTSWQQAEAPTEIPYIATIYKAPQMGENIQPSLTVRVDTLQEPLSLRAFTRQWIKDYPRLGFDVLNARPIHLHEQPGFLVDIVNKQTSHQLRQVVFLKDSVAVILTCRSHTKDFDQTVQQCNEIVRQFRWLRE